MSADTPDLVGQSLMFQFRGPKVTREVRDAMRRIMPCGIVLFSNNIEGYEQAYNLCQELQTEAKKLGLPPLLIAVDQEGGTVSRLPLPFVTVPSPMAQGATGDPEAAYECARITGRQLRAVGITVNFAPSLDVNNQPTNPVIRTRSFGDDAVEVSRFGLAALRGYEESRVIATVKHFPGHGDTAVDSHHGLPVVSHPRERLDAVELAPFAAAIAAGVPVVMTAHIIFEVFGDFPATLSHPILTGLLREELGFDGLIVTDAMDMGAIVNRYGHTEAAVAAKDAGADVLEMVDTLDRQVAVAEALHEALAAGRLPVERFSDTTARLQRLRRAYGVRHALPRLPKLVSTLDTQAMEVARRTITIVHGEEMLPLAPETRLAVIDCQKPRSSIAEDPADRIAALRDAIEAAFPRATCLAIGPEPDGETLNQVSDLATSSDTVLFLTRDANTHQPHEHLGHALASGPAPLIHAAVRAPYDAGLFPTARANLLTYGDPPVSLRALVDALSGQTQATGRSPVNLTPNA